MRSGRYSKPTIRCVPTGVPPSPSHFTALTPPRPMTQGNLRPPNRSPPGPTTKSNGVFIDPKILRGGLEGQSRSSWSSRGCAAISKSQQMPRFTRLHVQIICVLGAASGFQRDTFRHLDAMRFHHCNLSRIVGHQPNGAEPKPL